MNKRAVWFQAAHDQVQIPLRHLWNKGNIANKPFGEWYDLYLKSVKKIIFNICIFSRIETLLFCFLANLSISKNNQE
jgi:hypothetical protein